MTTAFRLEVDIWEHIENLDWLCCSLSEWYLKPFSAYQCCGVYLCVSNVTVFLSVHCVTKLPSKCSLNQLCCKWEHCSKARMALTTSHGSIIHYLHIPQHEDKSLRNQFLRQCVYNSSLTVSQCQVASTHIVHLHFILYFLLDFMLQWPWTALKVTQGQAATVDIITSY